MDITLDEKNSVIYVKPRSALREADFLQLAALADAQISQHGSLKGLVIETMKFPGWENFYAFIAHVKFIKNHHAKIQKIAIITDSPFALIGKTCIGPFVHPQIERFPYDQAEAAKRWIVE